MNLKIKDQRCSFCLEDLGFDSKTESLKDKKSKKSYWICNHCGLLGKNPELFVSSELEKKRYAVHNNDITDSRYLDYLNQLWSKTEGHISQSSSMSVLDFGCGPSKGLESLLKDKKQFKVSSYDPYFYNEDGFLKKTYDIVFCCEVVEHFNEPADSWNSILRLLSKDSLLAIRTEFWDDVRVTKPIEKWWYFRDPTHVHFYSKGFFNFLSKSFKVEPLYIASPYVLFSKQ